MFRPHRRLAALVLTLAAAAGAVTAAAPVAAAADPRPLAPVDLHPDGVSRFETALDPDSWFSADPAPADVGRGLSREFVVQHRAGTTWTTVADVHGSAQRLGLPLGPARWRARMTSSDGATTGAWSAWIVAPVVGAPAAPGVTVPDSTVVAGQPVAVTVSSPDGRAAALYLGGPGDATPVYSVGADPCGAVAVVCFVTGQRQATVPWSFHPDEPFSGQLTVTVLGRNGDLSPGTTVSPVVADDTAAASGATRWPVPTTGGPATTLPSTSGGPGLRVGPRLAVTTQTIPGFGDFVAASAAAPAADGDTVVPSIDLAQSTAVATTANVVDASRSFSVGAVLTAPTTNPTHDQTVLAQSGTRGLVFSLVLTHLGSWRFCVTRSDGASACADRSVTNPGLGGVVVARWDVTRQFASLDVAAQSARAGFGTRGVLDTVSGPLRFGAALVPGTQRYTGALGSPFVAAGWLSDAQATTLVSN